MYASKFGPVMEEMLTIRQRSGLQLKFIVFFLDDFDAFCAREYPEATLLTKEIAETWIHSSDSPSRHHMARRVLTMKHIGEYQQSLGLNAYVPNYRIKRSKAEEPHLFTDEQLSLFFKDPPHNCAQTIHIIPATQISRKSAIQAHYLHTK